MAGIDVLQLTTRRLVLGVEERCQEKGRGGFVDEAVDVADQRRQVQIGMQDLRSKRSLQTGHQQSGTDPFSGYVADGNAPTLARQREKIVIVASDATGWLIKCFTGQDGDRK